VLAWLAPFIDLINHSYTPNCKLETTQERVQVVAQQEVKKGTEVTFSYAKFPNAHFYWRYGFCLPDNEAEELQFPEDAKKVNQKVFNAFKRTEDLVHASMLQSCATNSIPQEGEDDGGDIESSEKEAESAKAKGLIEWLTKTAAACDDYLAQTDRPRDALAYIKERKAILSECRVVLERYCAFLED